MFAGIENIYPATVESNQQFYVEEILWSSAQETDNQLYQQITHKISRNPKSLIAHLQRIHTSYKSGWNEQLYASLSDLFFSLNGKGKPLSRRMLGSTRSLLSEQQYQLLEKYLSNYDKSLLTGNRFSILTQGLIGSSFIVKKDDKKAVTHDPLLIARDYIEYSQLDDAKITLESGIINKPKRQDLQIELLDLYKLTNDKAAFNKMHSHLLGRKIKLSADWLTLKEHFQEKNNETIEK